MPFNRFPSRHNMNQAVRIIGQLHLHRDLRTFHEETFTCRKFFLTGPDVATYHLNVRHLSFRPGEIIGSSDLESLFYFLRFLRKTPPQVRNRWFSSIPSNQIQARTFRWASRDRNDFVTAIVRGNRLLMVLSKDYESARRWIEYDAQSAGRHLLHTVSWY